MDDKKIEELIEKLEAYAKQLSTNKQKSKDFLIRVGIINDSGKLTKPYKHLCIPQEQA